MSAVVVSGAREKAVIGKENNFKQVQTCVTLHAHTQACTYPSTHTYMQWHPCLLLAERWCMHMPSNTKLCTRTDLTFVTCAHSRYLQAGDKRHVHPMHLQSHTCAPCTPLQAGERWRSFDAARRARFVERVVGMLADPRATQVRAACMQLQQYHTCTACMRAGPWAWQVSSCACNIISCPQSCQH